jgi:hypothetical protein
MPEKTYKGRTEDAEAPFLGADFWSVGKSVSGVVLRSFESVNGRCYVLGLVTPVEMAGEEVDEVSIGNMAGFRMAMQAAHLTDLRVKDKVFLSCYGKTPPKKEGNSPRVDFDIEVTVPEEY